MSQQTGIQKALLMFENSPTKLARAVGNDVLRQHVEHWLSAGRVPIEKCPAVFGVTAIPLAELNDKIDWAAFKEAVANDDATNVTAA